MRLSAFIIVLTVLGVCAIPARADQYLYEFHLDQETYQGVTYAAGDIAFTRTVGSGSLTYNSGSLNGWMGPDLGMGQSGSSASDEEFLWIGGAQNSGVTGLQMDLSDWHGVGDYASESGRRLFGGQGGADVGASLVVTEFTPTAPTPEPTSLMLLGTGVMGAAGVVRRRLGA